MSIRTKIFLSVSGLIIFVYILGCFSCIKILERQHIRELKERGVALAMQPAHNTKIISSLIHSQHVFPAILSERIQVLNNNDEVSYWKMYDFVLSGLMPTGVIFVFVGVCIAFFLSKRITSPLQSIIEITQEIAKGDFTRSVRIQSQDEIGLLAKNFNNMTKALENTYNELKQEIKKRKAF